MTPAQAAKQFKEDGYVVIPRLMAWPADHIVIRLKTLIKAYARAKGIQLPPKGTLDELFNVLCVAGRHHGGVIYRIMRHHPSVIWGLFDGGVMKYLNHIMFPYGAGHDDEIDIGLRHLHFRIDRKGEYGQHGNDWHQDFPYICTTPRGIVCWHALTDVTDAMGPMRIIPGSHKQGMWPTKIAPNYKKEWGNHHRIFQLANLPAPDAGISVPVAAGDMVFMHMFTVHKGGTNTTENSRWAIVARYDNLLDHEYVGRNWDSGMDGNKHWLAIEETPYWENIINRNEVIN